MEDDSILRIDADKDAIANMLELKVLSCILSSLYPENDINFRKLKACLMIFMEHGIPLQTSIDMLKEMGEKMNKIDEEEK